MKEQKKAELPLEFEQPISLSEVNSIEIPAGNSLSASSDKQNLLITLQAGTILDVVQGSITVKHITTGEAVIN